MAPEWDRALRDPHFMARHLRYGDSLCRRFRLAPTTDGDLVHNGILASDRLGKPPAALYLVMRTLAYNEWRKRKPEEGNPPPDAKSDPMLDLYLDIPRLIGPPSFSPEQKKIWKLQNADATDEQICTILGLTDARLGLIKKQIKLVQAEPVVWQLWAAGLNAAQIAKDNGFAEHEVKVIKRAIKDKLGPYR